MKLIPNAKKVLIGASSMQLIGASIAVQAVELLPVLQNVIPPGPYKWVALGVTVLAGVARLIKQEKLHDDE
jgi:hypothetical protein